MSGIGGHTVWPTGLFGLGPLAPYIRGPWKWGYRVYAAQTVCGLPEFVCCCRLGLNRGFIICSWCWKYKGQSRVPLLVINSNCQNVSHWNGNTQVFHLHGTGLEDGVLHLDGLVELQQQRLGLAVEDEREVVDEELVAETVQVKGTISCVEQSVMLS